MRSSFATIKADGRAELASPGVGFRIRPGAFPPSSSGYSRTQRPGSYPIQVKLDGQGDPITVLNGDSYYFGAEGFRFLQVVNGEAGDLWIVDVYENRGEGVTPDGRRQRVPYELAAAGTAVPAADPASATDGYALRNGQKAITTYWAGVLTQATLWVMRQDGTWFNTGEQVDATAAPYYDTRDVRVSAKRFYWRAAAANMTMCIEVDAENG